MVMQNADPVQCRTAVGQTLHGIISVFMASFSKPSDSLSPFHTSTVPMPVGRGTK